MKRNLLGSLVAAGLLATPLASVADTFFTDDFSHGSTLNGSSIPGGSPTASYTSYDVASTKATTASNSIAPGLLRLGLNAATSSGFWEVQALFTNNAIPLTYPGDYVDLVVVFTNRVGTNGQPGLFSGTTSALYIGLYNSSGSPTNLVPPVAGALADAGLTTTSGSTNATGNCANWAGYIGRIFSGAASSIITRPVQNGTGTTSANQDLVANGVGSGAFGNPGATSLGSSASQSFTVGVGPYTVEMRIALDPAGSGNLLISNALYSGVGTSGTALITNSVSTTNLTAVGFDGLAIGALNKVAGYDPQMDVSSITITGQSTPVTGPPTINTEPVSSSASIGATVPFSVSATGINVTYQWHRHGTNLLNGGTISGATGPNLLVGPLTSGDFASDYYCTVTGAGPFSTNSTTNSLSQRTAANLVWSGNGSVWDLANSADWLNGSTPSVFNYGDNVTFDDTPGDNGIYTVNLAYRYLSANSVTVNASSGNDYNFSPSSTGGISGAGSLVYKGAGRLIINNANTYTGGTLISNANAYLYLANVSGLGSGPVVCGMARADRGNVMEIVTAGGNGVGIGGDLVAADDFSIQLDTNGTYTCVVLGSLLGTAGKTLTFNAQTPTNYSRIRVYGTNAGCNANIVLNSLTGGTGTAATNGTTLAPYHGSGFQIYNGVISGVGGIIQRAGGITLLNGANTYTGGTTPTTGIIALGTNSDSGLTYGPIGTGPLFVAPELGSASGSGTIEAWGSARTIANPIVYPTTAPTNQTLIVGGTNALTLTGAIGLVGQDNAPTNRIFQVTNTALTTFSGQISGASYGLTKTGSGVLALTATEIYTGTTVVSAGTLQVNGVLDAGSAVTVTSNAVLGGTGVINGSVTVSAGGAIAPGTSIGTLTIGGNYTNSGNLTIEVDKSHSPMSDLIVLNGATAINTGTGTITVTNIGATALAVNDKFTLFSKAVTGGATMVITGGGPGVTWANNLATDGSISVAGIATAPTATTVAALPITASAATLNASVNPNGAAAACWFICTNAAFTNTTAKINLPSGTTAVSTNATLTGLLPGTTYYFQVVATNSVGTNTGNELSFTTLSVTAPKLTAPVLSGGTFTSTFTNTVGALFKVYTSTNVALPFSQWTLLGQATEVSPGNFQFSDAHATNTTEFYRLTQ
jgi:autotransporter-associated beta strand protein